VIEAVPHDIAVDFRPSGVGLKDMEAVTGDCPHTVDKLGTERGAEVVQPQFEVFMLSVVFEKTSSMGSSRCAAGDNGGRAKMPD
jgi:hypothetical protein